MQLFTPLALHPAGVVLKPIAAKRTVPNKASYALLRVTTSRSPLRAPWNERRMGCRRSFPAARTKARDEAEPEPQAPAKPGEKEEEAAKRKRGHRSSAYQTFEAVVLCIWILSWRIGDLIVYKAQEAFKRLRGNILDKFNQKR